MNIEMHEKMRPQIEELLSENNDLLVTVASLEKERRQMEEQLIASRQAIKENEHLRAMSASLELETIKLQDQTLTVRDELDRYLKDHERLRQKMAEIDAETKRFFEQQASRDDSKRAALMDYSTMAEALDRQELAAIVNEMKINEVKRRNFNLMNLYVTSFRLYERLDREEVLMGIQEVIRNLVGSEQLGIYEMSPDGATLNLANYFGIDPEIYKTIPVGHGLIGRAALTAKTYLNGQHDSEGRVPEEEELTACLPLKLGEKVIGAIAVFRLLPQKAGLEAFDKELFELLVTHAATALYCSGLYASATAS